MNNPIKIGDSVKLKSGGPVMTVCRRNAESYTEYWCVWFSTRPNCNFKFHEAIFSLDALSKIERD